MATLSAGNSYKRHATHMVLLSGRWHLPSLSIFRPNIFQSAQLERESLRKTSRWRQKISGASVWSAVQTISDTLPSESSVAQSDMISIVEACVIIHKTVVCKRRETYTGTVSTRLPEDEARMPTGVRLLQLSKTRSEQAQFWSEHLDGQEDPCFMPNLETH
jgi:hypothetical protein